MAAALRELVEAGADGRRALGEAGRRKALAEWSWPELVGRMNSAYLEAIAVRRRKERG